MSIFLQEKKGESKGCPENLIDGLGVA